MTRLVEVPTQFDDRTFDQFAASYAAASADGARLLFDAHATEWASPYGLVGLLAAGQAAGSGGEKPLLTVPGSAEVAGYWARAGFFREAAEQFEVHGKVPRVRPAEESDVLLPVTPVRAAEDVHEVVSRIQHRASAILAQVGLDPRATMGFAMALSEACQNIVEHAGTGGWVAVQSYHWRRRLARRVVVIAVADAGVGFRHSLEPSQARRFGGRWGDAAALEAALIQGVSRFRDPGRGQGLAGIRRYLTRWNGRIAIRSGTARIAIVPSWDDDVPMQEDLAPFPGAQVSLIVPEQDSAET
jgi:hypothetical protein